MRRETGRSLAVLVLALLGLGLGLLAMYLIIGAEAADLWLPGGLGGTSDPGTGGEPAATANPTGRSLAYQGADGAVYVVEVGTAGGEQVAPAGENVAWSPDGRQLAFSHLLEAGEEPVPLGAEGIFVLEMDSGEVRPAGNFWAGVEGLSWSPQGDALAFVAATPGIAFIPQVYVMDVTSGEAVMVSGRTENPGRPVWSPDGQFLAFIAQAAGETALFVTGRDGSGLTQLATEVLEDGMVVWRP